MSEKKKCDSLYTAKHRLRFEGLILHMFIELAGVAMQARITQKLKKQHLKRFFWIFFNEESVKLGFKNTILNSKPPHAILSLGHMCATYKRWKAGELEAWLNQ